MYCPSCGAENEKARPLCYRCGVSLRHLEPLAPRLPVWRGQSRFLRGLLLSLLAGLVILVAVFVLLFNLAPDPQPLPTPAPAWQVRQASSRAIADRPSPAPAALAHLTATLPPSSPSPTHTPFPTPSPAPTVSPTPELAELEGQLVDIRWTEPTLIGGEGQGGPTQQLLRDQQGRLWAFWEEHVAWQPPDRGYDAVHYRIWEDNAWGDLRDIPGSDNYGEPTATLLPDGRILVKAETTMIEPKPYLWFLWDGTQWSTVPEMESLMPLNEGIRSIAADSQGLIHLMGYPIRTWDGTSWRDGPKLGTILFHATALDTEGILHAVGSAFGQGSSQGIRKWTWDGTSWSASGDIYKPSTQEDGGYAPPALAIGPDGTFHVVWAGSGPLPRVTGATPPLPFWISYSRGRGGRWSEPQTLFGPVTVETGYRDTDLAVAPDGTVIVVWGDVKLGTGYRAYVIWGREDQWVEPIVLSPEDGDQHMWPVVAMDAAGRVHIIWKARKGVYHRMGTITD